jgi:hypothetical protein
MSDRKIQHPQVEQHSNSKSKLTVKHHEQQQVIFQKAKKISHNDKMKLIFHRNSNNMH